MTDGVFITSAAGSVIPVTQIDGETPGDAKPGPVASRLCEACREPHEIPDYVSPVEY